MFVTAKSGVTAAAVTFCSSNFHALLICCSFRFLYYPPSSPKPSKKIQSRRGIREIGLAS